MKRLWLVLVGCWLVLAGGSQVRAENAVLSTLERFRAEYPTPMAPWQLGELLNRVAWEHRADGWGLLKKTGGTRCPAPQGVEVACDILIHAPTINHYDVLIDAEGEAIPTWRDAGPCVLSPSSGCEMSRYLAPVSMTPPTPPPVPQGFRIVR